MGKGFLMVILAIAACIAGGCAVERLDAVEGIGGVDASLDASVNAAAVDASIDALADASDEGGALDDSPAPPSCEGDAAVFVTSEPLGMSSSGQFGDYFVRNNVYNATVDAGPQTLYACSYHSWYVVSDQADDAGAVVSYPNVQRNFGAAAAGVPISSFQTITSTFYETSPHVGVYEDSYDIWLNGIATPGDNQIMIWVDNYDDRRVPQGSKVTTVPFGGRTYDVWQTSDGSYVALVSTSTFTSGTLNLLEIFNWALDGGLLPPNSTLCQIDFGVEIVSTGGATATFNFEDFSITTN